MDALSLATLLQMIEAFENASVDQPIAEEPSGRSVQIVVNIYQAGAITGPFTQEQGVNMSDTYNVGAAGAVGKNARAEDFSINQNAENGAEKAHLAMLAAELAVLRGEMRRQADSVDDDTELVAVGNAQIAAESGDEAGAVNHLKGAGKWAIGVATSIGTGVAGAALKAALGL